MKEAIENVMIKDGGFTILFKAYCIAGLIVASIVTIYFAGITIKETIFMHEHRKRVKKYEEYKRKHRCKDSE